MGVRTKKARKGRRRGQTIPQGEGRYLLRYYAGIGADGKRKYPSVVFEGSKREAEKELTRLQGELDGGRHVGPCRKTLKEHFEDWIATKRGITAKTREDYRTLMENHVLPALGHRRIDKLDEGHVGRLCGELEDDKGLAPRTIQYVHSVLNQCLRWGVRVRRISRNPADEIDLPKVVQKERAVFTEEQLAHFLQSTEGTPLHPLWVLLFHTGLRPGEALALRWTDMSKDGHLTVDRALKRNGATGFVVGVPKTKGSRRTIPLTRATLDALEEHRTRQVKEMMKRGGKYERNGLIFANNIGRPLDIARIRRRFKVALKGTGSPSIRLYDARHTHATLMLKLHKNVKVVSERLGHASVKMTLDTYTHALPGLQAEAVETFDRALRQTGT